MCTKMIDEAWIMAARYATRAKASSSSEARELLNMQRDCWIDRANKLELTEWAKEAARRCLN
jgi:hypothetical protein